MVPKGSQWKPKGPDRIRPLSSSRVPWPPLVKRFAAFAALLVTMAACGGPAGPPPQTDIGITADTILLGNTTALSGPASANKTISYAANAYFNYVNASGASAGRKNTLQILDDASTATPTAHLTHQLVQPDERLTVPRAPAT